MTNESRERAWEKYRKARRGYLCDDQSFDAGWQAALSEGRRQGLKEAARLSDEWANSPSCTAHEDNPCCHVRKGAGIAAKIRALISQEKP